MRSSSKCPKSSSVPECGPRATLLASPRRGDLQMKDKYIGGRDAAGRAMHAAGGYFFRVSTIRLPTITATSPATAIGVHT
jgi:hypothetical protein